MWGGGRKSEAAGKLEVSLLNKRCEAQYNMCAAACVFRLAAAQEYFP